MPESLDNTERPVERPEISSATAVAPESGPASPEQAVERPAPVIERATKPVAAVPAPAITPKPATTPQPSANQDVVTARIEKIMEEGLADVYAKLTPAQKEDFRIAGEETLVKLRRLFGRAKLAITEVWILLRRWLFLLPNAGSAYLEQAAFIKAQQLAKLATELHHAIIR